MKSIKLFSLSAAALLITVAGTAQTKTESFKVSGNCGMCKNKIEKAAKEAGAKEASWNQESKEITVTYKSSSTNTAKIQQKIAEAGYDNAGFKATNDSYDKLHACCKYDRATEETAMMDCCKDGKCTKPGHDGKDCCKKESAMMDCCKDGKCTKPGHDGKDCCKTESGNAHH